jgi:hypothetical protein
MRAVSEALTRNVRNIFSCSDPFPPVPMPGAVHWQQSGRTGAHVWECVLAQIDDSHGPMPGRSYTACGPTGVGWRIPGRLAANLRFYWNSTNSTAAATPRHLCFAKGGGLVLQRMERVGLPQEAYLLCREPGKMGTTEQIDDGLSTRICRLQKTTGSLHTFVARRESEMCDVPLPGFPPCDASPLRRRVRLTRAGVVAR